MSFASTSSSSSFSDVGEEKSDKQYLSSSTTPTTRTTTTTTTTTEKKKHLHYQNDNWQRKYQHRTSQKSSFSSSSTLSPSSSTSVGSATDQRNDLKTTSTNDDVDVDVDVVRFIVILFDDEYGNFELMDGEENLSTNPSVQDVLSEIHYSTNQPIIRNTMYRGISAIYATTNTNSENDENYGKGNHGDEFGPNVPLRQVVEKSTSCTNNGRMNKNIHLFVGLPRSLTVEQCIQRGKLILRDSKVENLVCFCHETRLRPGVSNCPFDQNSLADTFIRLLCSRFSCIASFSWCGYNSFNNKGRVYFNGRREK